MRSGLPLFTICILRSSRRKLKLYFSWQDITKTARRGIPIVLSALCLMSSYLKSSSWMQGLMVMKIFFFPFVVCSWSKLPFSKKDCAVYFLEMMPIFQRCEACRMKWLRLREASATLCVSVVSQPTKALPPLFLALTHSFIYVLGTGELRSTSSSGYDAVPSQLGPLAGLKIKHIYCGYYYTIAVV